jgi:hypothetical protein
MIHFEADAGALKALLNCLGVTRTGPFRRRPYFICLRRRMSFGMENGSCPINASTPKMSGH